MDVYVINAPVEELNTRGDVLNRTFDEPWFLAVTTDGLAPDIAEFAPPPQVAGRVLTVLFLFSAAVVGNVTMCCAVLKTPNLRTVTNSFTINLAVTDLLVAVLVLPIWIISMATGASQPKGRAPFSDGLCQTTAFFTVMLQLVSIATSAGISLDRYFSICHPLRYPMKVTSRRVYMALAYIWTQSTALASAPALGWGRFTFRPKTIAICLPDWTSSPSYACFLLLVGLALPFSFMLFSYIRIVQEARKQASRIEQIQLKLVSPAEEEEPAIRDGPVTEGGSDSLRRKSIFQRMQIRRQSTISYNNKTYSTFKKNVKTLKTVFIVVGAFSVCWWPYVSVTIWTALSDRPVRLTADFITTLLVFCNSALNPVVFIFLTRDFRFAVRMLFARCARCLGKEDAVQRLRRESCVGLDSAMDTVRLHSRGSCDSGVDMGAAAGEEDRQDQGQRLRVPTTKHRPCLRMNTSEEENDTAESEDEVWSRPGTSRPINHVHVRVDFHGDSSSDDASVSYKDSIPLLAIAPSRDGD